MLPNLSLYQDLIPSLLQVTVVILVACIAIVVKNTLLNRLSSSESKRFSNQLQILAYAAKRPLTLWISLMAITFIARLIESHFDNPVLFHWIVPFRKVGMSLILVWFGARLIRKAEQHFLEKRFIHIPMDDTSILAAGKFMRVIVHIAGALVILPALGISISGVLALGGIGGIAVGFAAKDMVANFLGGAVLYGERPFSVGDMIESTDKDISGRVVSIGWRTTKIRRHDRRLMFVPNSIFSSITLINSSKRTHYRIYEVLNIRYQDAEKLPDIVKSLEQVLRTHSGVDQSDIIHVGLSKLSDSSIECLLWCFSNEKSRTGYLKVLEDILLKAYEVVSRHGAEMAFPTQTIHVSQQGLNHESS